MKTPAEYLVAIGENFAQQQFFYVDDSGGESGLNRPELRPTTVLPYDGSGGATQHDATLVDNNFDLLLNTSSKTQANDSGGAPLSDRPSFV